MLTCSSIKGLSIFFLSPLQLIIGGLRKSPVLWAICNDDKLFFKDHKSVLYGRLIETVCHVNLFERSSASEGSSMDAVCTC